MSLHLLVRRTGIGVRLFFIYFDRVKRGAQSMVACVLLRVACELGWLLSPMSYTGVAGEVLRNESSAERYRYPSWTPGVPTDEAAKRAETMPLRRSRDRWCCIEQHHARKENHPAFFVK